MQRIFCYPTGKAEKKICVSNIHIYINNLKEKKECVSKKENM